MRSLKELNEGETLGDIKIFRCRLALGPEEDPNVVLEGLGRMPMVTRVEPCPPGTFEVMSAEQKAQGYKMYDVFHTGPDGAVAVLHGEGFVFAGSQGHGVPWDL